MGVIAPKLPRATPSPPSGAERVGVRWGIPQRSPIPTSPSRRFATGSSLSPLKGGEGKKVKYAYLRDPAAIYRRSFATIRAEADFARFPPSLRPLALRLAHAAGDVAISVTSTAMRICGGAAFSKHLSIERLFRDAHAGAVMAPTGDVLREFIGKSLLGMPLF